jgi:hypothetical protein
MKNLENFINYINNNNIKKVEINNINIEKFGEALEFININLNNKGEFYYNNINIKYKSFSNYKEILYFNY